MGSRKWESCKIIFKVWQSFGSIPKYLKLQSYLLKNFITTEATKRFEFTRQQSTGFIPLGLREAFYHGGLRLFLSWGPKFKSKCGAHVAGSSGSGREHESHVEAFTFAFTAIHILTWATHSSTHVQYSHITHTHTHTHTHTDLYSPLIPTCYEQHKKKLKIINCHLWKFQLNKWPCLKVFLFRKKFTTTMGVALHGINCSQVLRRQEEHSNKKCNSPHKKSGRLGLSSFTTVISFQHTSFNLEQSQQLPGLRLGIYCWLCLDGELILLRYRKYILFLEYIKLFKYLIFKLGDEARERAHALRTVKKS